MVDTTMSSERYVHDIDDNDYDEMEMKEMGERDGEDREEGEEEGLLKKDEEEEEEEEEVVVDSGSKQGQGSSMEAMVARTVPTTDDPSLPSLTIRVIVLGVVFCIMGASASQVFYFKSNAPTFSSYFVILATYPLGHAMARWLPRKQILGVDLNPGPFNVKEHLLVAVISTSGGQSAYASDIISILRLYYHRDLSTVASLTLLITTQCLGFGLAGMLQDILVRPTSMYWPSTLVTVQLFTTLHDKKSEVTRKRMKLFTVVGSVVFFYQFLPTVFFTTLTSIATLCLINNQSWLLRTLGSGFDGLGILDFSLDWSAIGSSAPLYTPFWALLNYFAGLCGMIWVVVPIMLLTNFWNAREFPSAISAGLFTQNYTKFDVTSVLNKDLSLNEDAWQAARPLLLTPYFAVSYAFSFAALTSVLVHVWIWHRSEIMDSLARRTAHTDIHNKLMQAYPAVPHSWYIVTLGLNFIASVILVKTAPLQTEIWALVLAIALAVIFLVPVGIITAVSNTTIGLNVLTEFIAGILQPGKPIMNVMFKCVGYLSLLQAIALLGDQKLGHYMHINPRHMFLSQILGTVIGAIVNYYTLSQVIDSKRPFLDGTLVDPTGQWTGRAPSVFYSASVIYGAISPVRFFSGSYVWLYLGFPLGAIAPLILYQLHKRYPDKKFNKIVVPLICNGANTIPQYPTNIILSGLMAACATNMWLAKRYPDFHSRYIYVISSALDAATSMNAMAVYFVFSILLPGAQGPNWWGASRVDSEHCLPDS